MTVEDEALFAVEAKSVAGARRGRRDPVGAVLGAFVDRERDDRLSRSNGGEPAAGLRAARLCQRGDRADAGRQEGRRGQVASDFLETETRFPMPHAEPALPPGNAIGRAAGRARVCTSGKIPVVAGSLKK